MMEPEVARQLHWNGCGKKGVEPQARSNNGSRTSPRACVHRPPLPTDSLRRAVKVTPGEVAVHAPGHRRRWGALCAHQGGTGNRVHSGAPRRERDGAAARLVYPPAGSPSGSEHSEPGKELASVRASLTPGDDLKTGQVLEVGSARYRGPENVS